MLGGAVAAVPGAVELEQSLAIDRYRRPRRDRADRMQVAERPDDAGGAVVERRLDRIVGLGLVAIERMGRPAALRVASGDRAAATSHRRRDSRAG